MQKRFFHIKASLELIMHMGLLLLNNSYSRQNCNTSEDSGEELENDTECTLEERNDKDRLEHDCSTARDLLQHQLLDQPRPLLNVSFYQSQWVLQ